MPGSGSGQAHGHDGIRENSGREVLVIGATGELGAAGRAHALSDAASTCGRSTPAAAGRRSEAWTRSSAATCATGVARATRAPACSELFLVSSPTPDQVELETNAIEAAEHAGVEHIVKVSNIPIAGLESGLHGNHRAIERRLEASPVRGDGAAAVVLRDGARAPDSRSLRRGHLVLPTGDGQIAWIDPRDIADVAAAVLADPDRAGALHLTGPEALDGGRARRAIAGVTDADRRSSSRRWRVATVWSRRHGPVARRLDRAPLRSGRAGALADVSPDVDPCSAGRPAGWTSGARRVAAATRE